MPDKKFTGGIEPQLIRELAAVLRDSGLSEMEIEHGGLRVRLAVANGFAPAPSAVSYAPAPPHAPVPALAPPAAAAAHPGAVLSPMVGTAFLSPEPGAPAFVKVGDQVAEGQTLLIVEAMKTFNPIAAPRAGKLVEFLITNAQPVEFGQALAILE